MIAGVPKALACMLATFLLVLVWSGIRPHDYFTWALEVAPGVLGALILIVLFPRYRFSNLTYFFILVQAVILFAGGRYTYAENPLFEWIKIQFDLSRNYYDRLGHFFQGFTPALIAREVLLRQRVLNKQGWLAYFVLATALSISALYEFVEWWVALATGEAAEAFLGTQGDVWDTQWDMFMALCGAASALAFVSRAQNRSMSAIGWTGPRDDPQP